MARINGFAKKVFKARGIANSGDPRLNTSYLNLREDTLEAIVNALNAIPDPLQGDPGPAGPTTEWRANGGNLEARPAGSLTWNTVLPLASITGPQGPAGSIGTIDDGSLAETKLAPGVQDALDRARTAVTQINGETPDSDGSVTVEAVVTLAAILAVGAATVDMSGYDGLNGTVTYSQSGKAFDVAVVNGVAVGGAGGVPPGAPGKPVGTTGSSPGTATVTWAAPSVTGDHAVSGYQLNVRLASSTNEADWAPVATTGTSLSAALTGLTEGSYVARVRAGSDSGYGLWSATSDPFTVNAVPAGSWDYDFVQMFADGDTTLPDRFSIDGGQPFQIASTGLKVANGVSASALLTDLSSPYGLLELTFANKSGLVMSPKYGPLSAPTDAVTMEETQVTVAAGAVWPPDETHAITAPGPNNTWAAVMHPADGSHATHWIEFFQGGTLVYTYEGPVATGVTGARFGFGAPNTTITRIRFVAA